MKIKTISLQDLPDHIKNINFDCGFFGQFAWFELLTKHIFNPAGGFSGYLIGDDDHGQPEVIFPVRYLHRPWRPSYFSSLTCFYTPLYNCAILKKNGSIGPVPEFFISLNHGDFLWHHFIVYALPKETMETFTLQLASAGIRCSSFYCFANWFLPVTYANFDAYWATRSSRLRNTVKRKSTSFKKLEQSRIELFLSEETLHAAARHYQEVYNDSWKQNEAYPDFMLDLLQLAARQNALRLVIAYLGDVPIAAQFWIVADGAAYIYKLAYKEAYKSLGIGSVLTATLMQYVMDVDKVTTVDYLTGDDAYKQDWMTHRRERWGIEIFNTSTVFGFLLYKRETLKVFVKKAVLFLRSLGKRW